jgi:hypothetical protein
MFYFSGSGGLPPMHVAKRPALVGRSLLPRRSDANGVTAPGEITFDRIRQYSIGEEFYNDQASGTIIVPLAVRFNYIKHVRHMHNEAA